MEYYDAIRIYKLISKNENKIDESFKDELLGLLENEIIKKDKKTETIKSIVEKFIYKNDDQPQLKTANKLTINGIDYYAYCDGHKMAWSTTDYGFGVNESDKKIKLILEQSIKKKENPIVIPITDEIIKEMYSAMCLSKVYKSDKNRKYDGYIISGPNGYRIKVNPYYLKACIDFTEASELIADANTNSKSIILYGKEDRNAWLLPIRM